MVHGIFGLFPERRHTYFIFRSTTIGRVGRDKFTPSKIVFQVLIMRHYEVVGSRPTGNDNTVHYSQNHEFLYKKAEKYFGKTG